VQTSAEWLEAVLEGNVRSVAGGLGQYVQGFEGNYGSPSYAYTNAYRDGFDYLQRLMRAAAAVDDPSLQPQMRDAKFLSHLVNLGGAYAGLDLPTFFTPSTSHSFLTNVWANRNLQENASALKSFLQEFSSHTRQIEALEFQRKFIREVSNSADSALQADLKKPELIDALLDWGGKYIDARDDEDLFVNDLGGFLDVVALKGFDGSLNIASTDAQLLAIASQPPAWLTDIIKSNPFKHTRLYELAEIVPHTPQVSVDEIKAYFRLILTQAVKQQVWDPRQIGFMLGLSNHETLNFSKLEEVGTDAYFQGYDGLSTLMNDVTGDGKKYRGRGFVQLTGKLSYLDYANRRLVLNGVRLDLYNRPDLAAFPQIAAFILVDYLKQGRVTARSAAWEYTPYREKLPDGQTFSETPRGYWYEITKVQKRWLNLFDWSNIDVFANASTLVNQYDSSALSEVVSYSKTFSSKLHSFQGR
jgi:hypothetical protein